MPGSMSGEEKRSDGLLGERSHERRCAHLAPPVLYATALSLDSTVVQPTLIVETNGSNAVVWRTVLGQHYPGRVHLIELRKSRKRGVPRHSESETHRAEIHTVRQRIILLAQ